MEMVNTFLIGIEVVRLIKIIVRRKCKHCLITVPTYRQQPVIFKKSTLKFSIFHLKIENIFSRWGLGLLISGYFCTTVTQPYYTYRNAP